MFELGIEKVYEEIEKALASDDQTMAENLLWPAINQFPEDAQLYFYASHILVRNDKYALAKLTIDRSIALHPTGRAYGNLGAILRRMNRNAEAEIALDKAIEYEPNEKNAWNNKAANYVNEGNPWPGIEAAEKALEIDPDFVKAQWNLGLLQLEAGEFDQGWVNYRAGLALHDRMLRSYSRGDGTGPKLLESLDELTEYEKEHGRRARVIVYGEQGIGDEIMFSTILWDLNRYADIIFECHPRLIGMHKRTYGFVKEFYPTRKDDMLEWPLETDPCQFKCPIGDLGLFFRRDEGNFNNFTPKILPNRALVKKYRRTLEERFPGKRFVGVAWTGGVLRTMRWYRSIELPELYALGRRSDTVLVSLQYEDDGIAVQQYHNKVGDNLVSFPAITQHYDYDHTLALVCALDEVVTVCQSVAHLSAAAGKKTSVLVPDKPAWRYGLEGDSWYWYPREGVKLYRRSGQSWADATQKLFMDQDVGPMPFWERDLLKGTFEEGTTMLELGCKQMDKYKRWFEARGVEHTSVDLNGQGGALKLDLQEPLDLGVFDVVTNFGTTEHVDEQWQCWKNVHEAVKLGGTLISTTPYPGDWKHHGRWYPTAAWYKEFAEKNGYNIEYLGVSELTISAAKSTPYRNICVKMKKFEHYDYTFPSTPMYENSGHENIKTGAYV